MQLRERMKDARDEARLRVMDGRLERADRDRERLRTENDALRERLESADRERARWLAAVEDLTSRPTPNGKHRIRRLIVLTGTTGTAYLLGAKAGRDRYERFRARWQELRDRVTASRPAMNDGAEELSRGEDLPA